MKKETIEEVSGTYLIEYILILIFMIIAVILAFGSIGSMLNGKFNAISSQVQDQEMSEVYGGQVEALEKEKEHDSDDRPSFEGEESSANDVDSFKGISQKQESASDQNNENEVWIDVSSFETKRV